MTPHLAELRDALTRRSLSLFVGADANATLTGRPPRAALARELAERHGLAPGGGLAATSQQVMQHGNRFAFTDFLGRRLAAQGRAPGPLHRAVAALALPTVVTTCFDDLLETAYAELGLQPNRLVRDSDLPFTDPRRPTLIKLYGDLLQRDTLVVTEDDHYGLWRSRDKEGLLDEVRRLLRSSTMLFVGHDFTEPDFMLLWRETLDRMGRFVTGAFAVCPGLSADERRVWSERLVRVLDDDSLALLANLAGAEPPAQFPDPSPAMATPLPLLPARVTSPPPLVTTLLQPAATADLELWLRRRPGEPHEALATFRPPGSPADEHMVDGPPPLVALDPPQFLSARGHF